MRKSSFALSAAMLMSMITWCAGMVAFSPPELETISLAPDVTYPYATEPLLPPEVIEVVGPQPNPIGDPDI